MAQKVRQAGDSTRGTPWGEAWRRSCCDAAETVFRVRAGPDYNRNRLKEPSDAPFFEPVAFDVFKLAQKHTHIARYVRLPKIPEELQGPINGVPPFLIINCLLPNYDPPNPLWGATKEDGPGHSVVVYLLMREEVRQQLKDLDNAPASLALYRRFVLDEAERVRFKAMANLINPDVLDMGFAVRKLLTEYNMKPILTRPQHSFYTDNHSYFEIDMDVHLFSYIARKGLSMIRGMIEKMVWDIGLTVEGWSDEELPENILSVVHLHHLDLSEGEDIDFTTAPLVKPDDWTDEDNSVSLEDLRVHHMRRVYDGETNDSAACSSPDQSLLDLFDDVDDVPALRKQQPAAGAADAAQRAARNETPKVEDDDDGDGDFEDCVEDQ